MRQGRASGAAGSDRHGLTAFATALLLAIAPCAAARAEARLIEEIPYTGSGDEGAAGDPEGPQRFAANLGEAPSLDLFLPEAEGGPVLLFVHSRFWDRVTKGRDLARRFARPLQRAGVAVAIMRHRLAPDHPHPAAAEDVATAIAYLLEHADDYGYDREQLYLAGHASGAQLATLVALDPQYLAAHGLTPDRVRGVAAWSGIYDLDPPKDAVGPEELALFARAFGDAATRRAASPLRHVRPDAPRMLLMVAQNDLPGAGENANAFALALREAGHEAAETFTLGGRDHWSALDLTDSTNPARRHLLALLGLDKSFGTIDDLFETRRFWRNPTLTTAGFWSDEKHVVEHAPDERFLHVLNLLFAKPALPQPLRPSRYFALDLLAYVERHVQGSGGFLTVTNARGEEVVWRLSELAPFEPVIVIGLDDQRELFRLADVYHTRRRYSWKQTQDEPWVLARPLGAFVHFRNPPPARIDPKLFARFGLQPDSFRVSEADPLAALEDLPAAERGLLTEDFRCISCHRFRGVGARAFHLRARDAEPVGGFALPLEEYPAQVWRRYCFEQNEVAEEIGATPVALGDRARLLFELVEAERRR